MWTILAVYLRKTEQRWPSSAWNGAYLIVGGMQLIALHPRAPTHFGLFTWGPLLAATFGQMVLLGGRRLFRGSLSVPQRVSLFVWPVTNILCMPDLAFAAGCSGGLDATAFHPAMAGFSFCIVAEAMAELAEWYALLNTMHSDLLVQRTALREQSHALVSLSDELRTQVHGRASSLATALARLAKNQSRKGATELPFDQRYTFGEVLGEGGMGCVYAAKRHSDGREVAIKLLRNTKDFTLVSRFAREAEIATSLAHPHVVAVHDFGIAENGVPYLVMERIFGPSLRDMAEYHGNVTWSLPVLNGIAEGLAALHARGILHRDLKPANILLEFRVDSPRPHPKLTDFGLSSKHLAPKGHPDESSVTLTRPGETVGTPTYMSPEAMFDPTLVTQATDIFSFGLIAVELLTGLPPPVNPPLGFALASDPHATLPPLRVLCPELPASTAAVLLDCLQRDPSLRPTAAMLAQALATKSLSNDRNPSLGDALRARLARKTRLS
jgi:hypothetical protein